MATLDSFVDQVEHCEPILIAIAERIADAFQVGKRLAGITYPRHGFVPGRVAAGSASRARK